MMISGGDLYEHSLVEYDMLNDVMIDYGENYLLDTLGNENGEDGTNHFTQIGNILYTSDYSGETINVYDLETLSFSQIDRTHPDDDRFPSCLTSSTFPTARLYLVGGHRWNSNKLRVFDLEDQMWLDNMPNLITKRKSHGCVAVNDRVWAVAGYDVKKVEAINITDISTASWVQMESLPFGLHAPGVFAVDETIYVVGGWSADIDRSDTVYTIDTSTGAVSNYSHILPYPMMHMFPMLVGDVVYGFGGNSVANGGYLDSWFTAISGTFLVWTCSVYLVWCIFDAVRSCSMLSVGNLT